MSPLSTETTVYALLIGIDGYRDDLILGKIIFPKLGGCINDTNQVLEYLQRDTSLDLKLIALHDEQATKSAIISAFESQLSQAGPNDTILVYYSGHGTVEIADTEVWTDESDGRLEALVCYYDDVYTPDFLMTDKELRYLINELYDKTKAHIVTIFDCCHSGDNTRAIMDSDIRQRRVDHEFPMRQWTDFIFSSNFKKSDFAEKSISQVMPQGAHVQMSASESDEPAIEIGGEGVFTKHLLSALSKSGGNLSYADLHSRVRNKMNAVFQQKPKLYAPNEYTELLQTGFLNREVGVEGGGSIIYNENKKSWILNRGVVHGVEEHITKVDLTLPDGRHVQGSVSSTDLDSAEVKFDLDTLLDISMGYQVTTDGIKRETIKLRILNKNVTDDESLGILEELSGLEDNGMLTFVDGEKEADYDLVLWNDICYLTLPADSLRPLVEPVYTDEPKRTGVIYNYISHISRWTFQKNLENTGTNKIPVDYLKFEFEYIDAFGNATKVEPDEHDTIPLTLTSNNAGESWGGKLQIKVTNDTSDSSNLYVAGIYMPLDFSADTRLFQPQVKMIEPGKHEIIMEERGGIPFSLDPKWYWYNWKKEENCLNFIFSTNPFSEEQLQKSALPGPWLPNATRTAKGLVLDPRPTIVSGWATKSFKLIFNNPKYDQDNEYKIEQLFKYDQELENQGDRTYIGHFASGLYLEQNGLGRVVVKTSETDEGRTKGRLMNTAIAAANKWSNYRRNRRYKKMLKKLPNVPRLLSEGDSWFQHPLLNDIIDCIGRFYPIYCLSAAGDTIRNYIKGGEFIAEIEKLNPSAFLISGGGNDILGESMRKFLSDSVPANPKPADFFTDQLKNEIKAVIDIYRTIFEYYQRHKPDLPIIVHGYDYPRPLQPRIKKMSWMGKYLDEKNIMDLEDRTAVSYYLIDTFNQSLEKVTSEFEGVHYLDLRGIAKDDQWDDEIHPDDIGFQNISLRFIQRINSLV